MSKSNGHKKTPALAGAEVWGNEINYQEEIVMSNATAIPVENNVQSRTAQIISFKFGKQQVRTLLIDEQPWFVAADVCGSLAIGNVSLAVNGRADREGDGLDADEKGIASVNTPSGDQEMLVVNESGLYSLIFKSRKAEAKRFKKWVTAEVLPAIRKHGQYDDQGKMTVLLDQLSLSQFNIIKGVIRDKAKAVPAENRQSFQLVMHNRLHTRFNVSRTELIPASEFESACSFVASYAIEGEYLGREEKGVELPAELSPTQRFIVFTDGAGNRQVHPVPIDAFVMSPMQFLGAIAGENGIHVPPADLFDFALAAMAKLKWKVAA
ncbi:prophage antirepressor [Pseudomonas sp. GM79]|uniref:BRO-N domain-containing protein n=1 Tax=Pseudomonas sp. GM79 TaxID=1144338 RepID=UPI00026F7CAC|nr:BRO family protein [Pseudomonas sp. GM79]EJN17227.1 prophage antirepressor [Pseudomonas sp. GM79]